MAEGILPGDPLGIETWVASMLGDVREFRGRKAIHDHVLGTNIFEPFEMALVETPLLQRLRYISQTAFVYLTYPGARHTRFEHTLGAAVLVQRYAEALNARCGAGTVDSTALQELRIAALMHDTGHGLFSHVSEWIYQHLPQFQSLKREPQFSIKGAGELMSYFIVTSAPFRDFFGRLCEKYGLDLNLDHIAGYIIGKPWDNGRAYLAEIISGPFDVDKLDYIHRDAHATGLRLVVDIERFFYAITLTTAEDESIRLAIKTPEPLEQLIFSKMMLFASVYHHPKVKACDSLFKGAFEWARRMEKPLAGRDFSTPADFLATTDIEFLSTSDNPLVNRLRNRDLLHRAVAISTETVVGWTEGKAPGMHDLRKVADTRTGLRDLSRAIYDALPKDIKDKLLPEEIWMDIPSVPKLKELSLANIARGDNMSIAAEKIFPTEGWLQAYGTFRSKGHIFAPRDVCADVYSVATDILAQEPFRLSFNREAVRAICHW